MEIKTACPLKACLIKTCFSVTTIIFMQEEKEKIFLNSGEEPTFVLSKHI